MNCNDFRQKVHELLDGELPAAETSQLLAHLEGCPDCRQIHGEFAWMKHRLSPGRITLSGPAQEELWGRIRTERGRTWRSYLSKILQDFRGLPHQFEFQFLWSRVAAVPVTLILFIAILVPFAHVDASQWDREPVMSTLSVVRLVTKPVVTQVPVHHKNPEFNDLMDIVWKIPYEDELSLLAEITPEGRAETENVLQYPRNRDLLRAVNLTLQESLFGQANPSSGSFVIYSFQKVDVYEAKRGL